MAINLLHQRCLIRASIGQVLRFRRTFSQDTNDSNDPKGSKDSANKASKLTEKKSANDDTIKRLNVLLDDLLKNKDKKSEIQLAQPTKKRKPKPPKTDESTIIDASVKSVDPKYVHAVDEITKTMPVEKVTKTKSELLLKLLQENPENVKSTKLADLIGNMDVEQTAKPPSRAEQVRQALREQQSTRRATQQTRDRRQSSAPLEHFPLFSDETLGVFSLNETYADDIKLKTWQTLRKRDLTLAVTHPPTNYFQQMIQWTNQGKLWKFPIDNEQDFDERNVFFADHVFVEQYLEPWCPPKGPIKHFMELVCVGLSKNHWLSADEKKAHVLWYRDYFARNGQLLAEVGAINADEKAKIEELSK